METEFSGLLGIAERTPGLYFSYDVNITLRWFNFQLIVFDYKSVGLFFIVKVELSRWTSLFPTIGILQVTLRSLNSDGLIQPFVWLGLSYCYVNAVKSLWRNHVVIWIISYALLYWGLLYSQQFHTYIRYLTPLSIMLLFFSGIISKERETYDYITLSSNRLPGWHLLSHLPRLFGDPVSTERFRQYFDYPAVHKLVWPSLMRKLYFDVFRGPCKIAPETLLVER